MRTSIKKKLVVLMAAFVFAGSITGTAISSTEVKAWSGTDRTTGMTPVRESPYKVATTICWIPGETDVTVLETHTNSYGHLWYKIQWYGVTGWAFAENFYHWDD